MIYQFTRGEFKYHLKINYFNRAMANFPKDQTEQELLVLPKLAFFLATQDQFSADIRKALSSMNSAYEEVFQDMLNMCVDYIDSGHFITAKTKHTYLRVS